jgi:hypothetical protein
MTAQRVVLNLAVAIGTIAVSGAVAADENRGTWEQQMACTPDVFRLCGEQIPDVNRIVGCLRQNTAQLSSSCRAVFESNDSVQQPATPRHATSKHVTPQHAIPQQPVAPGRREYDE